MIKLLKKLFGYNTTEVSENIPQPKPCSPTTMSGYRIDDGDNVRYGYYIKFNIEYNGEIIEHLICNPTEDIEIVRENLNMKNNLEI